MHAPATQFEPPGQVTFAQRPVAALPPPGVVDEVSLPVDIPPLLLLVSNILQLKKEIKHKHERNKKILLFILIYPLYFLLLFELYQIADSLSAID
jgi:hypothetical protein